MWRWTRFIIQAFLAVAGHELCGVLGKQIIKMLHVCRSEAFRSACDKCAVHPDDDDRISVFNVVVDEAIALGTIVPPGRMDAEGWKDARELPDDVFRNVG